MAQNLLSEKREEGACAPSRLGFVLSGLSLAIEAARESVRRGDEPFGAVLVRDGAVVATGCNGIYTRGDRTAHAELTLVQEYCRSAGVTDLSAYTLYSSCEPCYMCSGALVWAKLGRLP